MFKKRKKPEIKKETENLEGLTVKELKEEVKEQGLENYSKLNKADLIDEIVDSKKEGEATETNNGDVAQEENIKDINVDSENVSEQEEQEKLQIDLNSSKSIDDEKAKQFDNPDQIGSDAEFYGSKENQGSNSGMDEAPLFLNSSTIHEATYLIGEDEVQLGTIVQKSFEESGLTVEEWNGLEDNERDSKIDFILDSMQIEKNMGIGLDKTKLGKTKESEQEKSIKKVIALRVLIDEAIQFAEVSLGKRNNVSISLFKSKAWLGKLLEQLGTANPYLTAKPVRTVNEIPATADVAQGIAKLVYDFKLKNDVEQIVSLREAVRFNIDRVESLETTMGFIEDKRLAAIAKTQSYVNLCEARFELGYELGLIRDKNK